MYRKFEKLCDEINLVLPRKVQNGLKVIYALSILHYHLIMT